MTSVISLMPQIVKSYKTKSVGDLSILMIINFLISSICWTLYGILIDAVSVWATNIVMTVFSLILMNFKFKYDK
ncbi:MAG: SemiSWEET family sugar transporter [Rickettsiaceae bacterium]